VIGPLGVAMREPTTVELAEFHRDHAKVALLMAEYRLYREANG
jgi:hypothetical protein